MLASSWKWTARHIDMSREPDRNAKLREALWVVARQHQRYGYRRLWALLVRQGWEVNVKRIHRLYKAEGMMVRRLKRKEAQPAGTARTHCWCGRIRNGPWTLCRMHWQPAVRCERST